MITKDVKTETRRLLALKGRTQEEVNAITSFCQDGDGNWIGHFGNGDLTKLAEFTKKAYPKGSNKGIKSKYQIGDRCYLTEPTQIESDDTNKSFARCHVEITDVKLERLFDITTKSAIAEGIKYIKRPELACPVYFDYIRKEYLFSSPIDSYISEIEMLHGKAIADSNPWVWAYKFKLIS